MRRPAPETPDEEKPKSSFTLKPDMSKMRPAFWTVASTLSMIVNMILIIVVIVLVMFLFQINTIVEHGLIGGLYDNFVKMDEASIITMIEVKETIVVQDTIPVVFDLPLKQNTDVVLTKDMSIPNTIVYLNGIPIYTTVVLPSGTPLSIALDLTVPVSTTIPVVLNVPVALKVPVDIPLEQTELHEPFVGLRNVLAPFRALLGGLPDSWEEVFGGDK